MSRLLLAGPGLVLAGIRAIRTPCLPRHSQLYRMSTVTLMPATAFPALQNVHSHTHACHGIPSSTESPQSHSFSPLDKRWVIQWSCLVWDGYYRSWNTASEGRPEEGEVGRWHLLSQANRTKPNTLCDKPCLPLHLSTEKEPQRGKCTHLMTHS